MNDQQSTQHQFTLYYHAFLLLLSYITLLMRGIEICFMGWVLMWRVFGWLEWVVLDNRTERTKFYVILIEWFKIDTSYKIVPVLCSGWSNSSGHQLGPDRMWLWRGGSDEGRVRRSDGSRPSDDTRVILLRAPVHTNWQRKTEKRQNSCTLLGGERNIPRQMKADQHDKKQQ